MIEPRIVVALANSVWQSAILVLFTATILRIMSRTSAHLRYAVWLATLAVCVLLPAVDYGFAKHITEPAASAPRSLNLSGTAAGTAIEAVHVTTPGATHFTVSDPGSNSQSNSFLGTSSTRVVTQGLAVREGAVRIPAWLKPATWSVLFARYAYRASNILFWLWVGVADLLLARLVFQLVSLVRAKRRMEIIDTFDWISQRPGVRRRYSVGISDTLDIPCLLGLTQPLIAIPRAIANELSSNDLRRIVLHESAHVRRYDDWFNLFEQCVLALLFFNPALYYATRALHLEREIACDDQVVASDERLFYAECLSVLAGRTRIRSTSFVPSFFSGRRELLIRIEQLLDRKHVAGGRLGIIPYAIAALLGTLALALGQIGIPVLAAPTNAPNTQVAQQHHASQTPSAKNAKPVPKATHSQHVIRADEVTTINVRVVGKPAISHVTSRKRVRLSAESASQLVTQSNTFVVNDQSVCVVAPTAKVMPPVSAVAPTVVEAAPFPSHETAATVVTPAATVVAPAPPCAQAPSLPNAGHRVIRIERNSKVIVICDKSGPNVHQHVRLTDADIKALKAAGCTVIEPIDIEKVRVDSMRDIDMKAMRAQVAQAMAEMRRSMQSMPREHDLSQLYAMRAFAESQARVGAAEAKERAAEMRREIAELRKLRVMAPMKIDMSMPQIQMPAIEMIDAEATLPQLPVKEITDMCNHGVTGAYITSLSRVGYSGLPAADYIRLHDHGVTAESIERLSRAHPGTKLSVDDLIRLQP